ncbi:MAG: hypothetical protein HYZ75_12190 [Elusimicrobia bacterium]|nr:hypothetical protein [Elusimicrobiota bacterium]
MSRPSGVVLLLLLAVLPARAAFDDLGAGARAPGMGNAFTALADDVQAIHYNPAGLAQLERPQASAGYARFYMGLSDGSDLGLSQFAYAHPLRSGRWGTGGLQLQRFALDDIYSEQTIGISWGKLVRSRESRKILMGFSFKQLSRGFKPPAEAANAKDNLGAVTGTPDPLLSGTNQKSAFDLDMGVLARLGGRTQLGLVVKHFMQPDVSFGGGDKLPMDIRLGAAYKALWMNLTGELRSVKGPSGSADRDILVGVERFFPSLTGGNFGVRGGLGIGSREFRQVSAGLSYRINKIGIDYAFLMPMGTISETMGTHRFSFNFHFGAPSPEDEISGALLEDVRRAREGKDPEYGKDYSDALRPRDLTDPSLARVKALVEVGRYREARGTLLELAKNLPADPALNRLANRLGLVVYYYSEQPSKPEKAMENLAKMISSFLYARDREAVLFGSYALSMVPNDAKLDNFLKKVEEGVGIPAERLPSGHPRTFMAELLQRVEAAHNRGDSDRSLALLEDIATLDPANVRMLERLGSTYYITGRYNEALDAWNKALPQEKDAGERRALEEYMAKARAALGQAPTQLPGGPAAAAPAPVRAVAPIDRAAQALDASPDQIAAPRKVDPREVERLYQKGVEHYARGEQLQATAAFMRVLQLDPENVPARRALERLKKR